jgi:hypothetical protein
MRRAWNFLVDLLDGLLAGLLYGHEGGLGIYSTRAEAENAHKLRRWAASHPSRSSEETTPRQRLETRADFDARMRRFRRETTRPPDP